MGPDTGSWYMYGVAVEGAEDMSPVAVVVTCVLPLAVASPSCCRPPNDLDGISNG